MLAAIIDKNFDEYCPDNYAYVKALQECPRVPFEHAVDFFPELREILSERFWDSPDEEDEDTLMTKLSTLMRNEYSIATLLSLLVWFVFSPQCIATFGVLRRETNGFRYPVIFGVYTLILAYIFSFIVFSIAS